MANGRTPSELTEQQIFLASALSEEPRTFNQLCDQAEKDGYPGTITKPHWKVLVHLGYAEAVSDRFGNIVGLKRGQRWDEFYRNSGDESTRKGLDYLEVVAEIEGLIVELNLTDYFNDLRNATPRAG